MTRIDGRAPADLRPVEIRTGVQRHPLGSAEISFGNTRVLCAASVEDKVPPFLRNSGRGWVTAEYSMLPSSTDTRTAREVNSGRPSGRTQEIQRLIGRSLRAVTPMDQLGERTITIDCDVLEADGGTRTASITGGYVALAIAIRRLVAAGLVPAGALPGGVAAVSMGIVDGVPMLDLAYEEDRRADADVNVVMAADLRVIEIQGTAEANPFTRAELSQLLDMAQAGVERLLAVQREAIATAG